MEKGLITMEDVEMAVADGELMSFRSIVESEFYYNLLTLVEN